MPIRKCIRNGPSIKIKLARKFREAPMSVYNLTDWLKNRFQCSENRTGRRRARTIVCDFFEMFHFNKSGVLSFY
jgi:hypothetical protein